MRALVLSFGVSGKASAALLRKKGWEVLAADRDAAKMAGGDVPVVPDAPDLDLSQIGLVVVSPGIPDRHPLVEKARGLGIETTSEIELAMREISNVCVGVTGTNGKTTVTLLVAHVLNAVGKKALAVGNVGTALSEYALRGGDEILVVELSSYQLEWLKAQKLKAAVYLNLTPDHLERYGTLEQYAESKAKIQDCLLPEGKLFVSREVAKRWRSLFRIPVQVFDLIHWEMKPDARAGTPERQNVLAAFALCQELGVPREAFERALRSFRKPAHRVEWVAEVAGVHYYDDSKGTNIDAVMHAMDLFDDPVILIAGGVDKGASYRPWIDSFQGKVRKMIAYGEAAPKMESELASSFCFQRVETMGEAVKIARGEAQMGEVVLLSPGCSSYDQFRNYAHRGEEFKRLVKEFT